MKKDKFSAGSLEIGFEGGLPETYTAHAGVSLLEAVRRSGIIATADRILPGKKNPKGLIQGQLFSDGNRVKLFTVVTNDWEMGGQDLLAWHRRKAGSVEQSHRILKDELAAGVYPSGKFGANAAWLRLQVLTHNGLVLMKATALDEAYRQARPKRPRFAIFNHVGRVVQHARLTLMRVVDWVLMTIIGPGLVRLRTAPWPVA